MKMSNTTIFGIHTVSTFLELYPHVILKIITKKESSNPRTLEIVKKAKLHNIAVEYWSSNKIDQTFKSNHQNIIAECKELPKLHEKDLYKLIEHKDKAFFMILDQVTDPNNLGAIIRTSAAMDVDCIIAPRTNSASITPTVRKIACGGTELVPFVQVGNLSRVINNLKEHGMWIYGTAEKADNSLFNASFPNKLALVLGAESTGIRDLTRKSCDELLNIPLTSPIGSLNVSVAAGIFIYEVFKQFSINQ